MTVTFNPLTMAIFEDIRKAGGRPFVVGGSVRDIVMGIDNNDIDVEVFGMNFNDLMFILELHCHNVDAVGVSFGIIKVDMRSMGGDVLDFSLPRTDNRTGRGHRGFVITTNPNMTMREAARRRDVTINSMSMNPFTGEVIDLFGGMRDIRRRVLRATSWRFIEDALRVLRLVQFAARFDMKVSFGTLLFSRWMGRDFPALPVSRIWEEFSKLFLKGVNISNGLRVLVETGWIKFFPALNALRRIPQDKIWHPEGNVWEHTLMAIDHARVVVDREGLTGDDALVIFFAVLLHDTGKLGHTEKVNGRIISVGHDVAGEAPTREFLASIGCPKRIVERVVPLVVNHMAHIHNNNFSMKAVRRLARRIAPATIDELALVMECDHTGRGGDISENRHINTENMVALAHTENITDEAPAPILMGRHLIEMGFAPSPEFGVMLNEAFEAQLDGVFNTLEGALEWFNAR